MKLVLPSTNYKSSFIKNLGDLYLFEYKTAGMSENEIKKNFSKFVKIINGHKKGAGLSKGAVPSSTFWLVDGKKYLGSVNIRHRLNKSLKKFSGHIGYEISQSARKNGYGNLILKLALKKARLLGIKNVVISTDENNIASKKIIEKNGGRLIAKILDKKNSPLILKYIISLKNTQ